MADLGVSRDVGAVEVFALGVGVLDEKAGEGRPDAEAFADAGLEVGELAGFGVGDG